MKALLIVASSILKVIELCGRTAGTGTREARHARDPKNPDACVRFDRGQGPRQARRGPARYQLVISSPGGYIPLTMAGRDRN